MERDRLLERDDELCRLINACEDDAEMERLTEEKCIVETMLMAMPRPMPMPRVPLVDGAGI